MKRLIFTIVILLTWCSAYASLHLVSSPAIVSACFTPYQNCTRAIVKHINQAKNSIYMQAYSFTSGKIAYALLRAHRRGVKVQVILDKSNFDCSRFSFASLLIRKGIPVWNDFKPNIAHNKVMIFDNNVVETGSFNYTKSAQRYNAENVIFVDSKQIADEYVKNWYKRQEESKKIMSDPCPTRYYH